MAESVCPSRTELHNVLLGFAGSGHVFFQPPPNVRISYPCFVYSLRDMNARFADDGPYIVSDWYDVTYITKDPDDLVVQNLVKIKGFVFNRWFAADDLNHYAFIYHVFSKENE